MNFLSFHEGSRKCLEWLCRAENSILWRRNWNESSFCTAHEQNSVGSQLLCSLFEYALSFAPLSWSYLTLYSSIRHQKYTWNYSSRREHPFQLLNANAFSFKCSASVANGISIVKRHSKTMVNDGEKIYTLLNVSGPRDMEASVSLGTVTFTSAL